MIGLGYEWRINIMKSEKIVIVSAVSAGLALHSNHEINTNDIREIAMVNNPLTDVTFVRAKTHDGKLIIWEYTRVNKTVKRQYHRTYRFKIFDFRTFDDEVMTINVLFDMGYRVREIAAFTGYSPSTCTRRKNAIQNESAYPSEKYLDFKENAMKHFKK
jgi:hypothetical protein